jgi:hypothetical protein
MSDGKVLAILAGSIVGTFVTIFAVAPHYGAYGARITADGQKYVIIAKAQAELEAAKLRSQQEIEHAESVAKANEIISESLKDKEVYLRYLEAKER